MAALKTSAMKKLVEYNKLIDVVKEKEAKEDASLQPSLPSSNKKPKPSKNKSTDLRLKWKLYKTTEMKLKQT
jgi:hypothetical protein